MLLRHFFYALFPKKCFICRSQIDTDSTLCPDCYNIAMLPDYCHQCCNYTVPDIGCVHCQTNPSYSAVDKFILGYVYEKAIREAIVQLKYHHKMYMVRVIKELIAPVIKQNMSLLDHIDFIMPMPVDRVRLAGRGFNHMFEIAKVVQQLIDKPILYDVLKKRSFTIPQSGLPKRERLQNLRSSFICEAVTGNVLLLDDVLTTGKTLHHSSYALKRAGASMVTALVIAKA